MLDIYRNNMNIIKEQEKAITEIEILLEKLLTKIPHNLNWIYLYGGPGQGKTMIANLIIGALPKLKCVFIHSLELINILQNNQQKFEFDLLIIDEFDIRDVVASPLIRDYLAENAKKIIVFTSNIKPDNLYKNGLQRQMFLSAIEQIKKQALIIELNIGKDIRKNIKSKSKNFKVFSSIQDAKTQIYKEFLALCTQKVISEKINVNNRYITLLYTCKNLLYIDLSSLCDVALGSEDYIEICKRFNCIFIGGFYNPDINSIDIARRIIVFIDIAYLYKTKLIIGFDFDFKKLDKFVKIMPEISRTISRLYEIFFIDI